MASARVLRSAAESGRLPGVCICCGEPADRFVRQRFRWQPGWWLLSMPIVLVLLVGVVLALNALNVPRFVGKALVLVLIVYLIPLDAGDHLAVPVCPAHRYRLKWHEFFLWFVLLGLLGVAAGTVYAAVIRDMELAEQVLWVVLIGAPLLLLGSIAIRFCSPRVVASEGGHLDMAMLSSEFAQALGRPTGNLHTLSSQLVGRRLPSGLAAIPRWLLIAGGSGALVVVLLVASCAGLPQLVKWNERRRLNEFVAQNAAEREQRKNAPLEPFAGRNSPARPAPGPPAPPPPPPPPPPDISNERAEAPISNPKPPAEPSQPTTNPPSDNRPARSPMPARAPSDREAPGFAIESGEELHKEDLLHVWTGGSWRRGVVVEASGDQVRVRLLGAPPTAGEWVPITDVRHVMPPAARAARARAFAKRASMPGPPTPSRTGPSTSGSSPASAPVVKPNTLRTWTDATGRFQIEAELIKVENDEAHLRKPDGTTIRIAISKLSPSDREYAEKRPGGTQRR